MINCIVAVTSTGIIGDTKTNDLLWHIPQDMKRFKELTMGHVVLMGRKTYESIPEKFRPLPGRDNVVCSSGARRPPELFDNKTALVHAGNPVDYVRFFREDHSDLELFVIGGGSVYEQTLDVCDRFYVTLVQERHFSVEDAPSRVRFPIAKLFDQVGRGLTVTDMQMHPGFQFFTLERQG